MTGPSSGQRTRQVACRAVLSQRRYSDGFHSFHLSARQLGDHCDPLLSVEHFFMRAPYFRPHPHAGFSAVTTLFEDSEGAFLNRDSLGDRSVIDPGGLHWTTAGRGVVHEEVPAERGKLCHGVQLFVNLPAAMKQIAPSSQKLVASDVPAVAAAPGARLRVLVGAALGVRSPLAPPAPFTLLEATLDPGASLAVELPKDDTAIVYVISGVVSVGEVSAGSEARVSARQAAGLTPGDRLELTGGEQGAQALVLGGPPLREPVVEQGPFVMTTQEEIDRAVADYEAGRMGELSPSF